MVSINTTDLTIVITWLLGMILIGLIISFRSKTTTSQDYFLASKALPWWAVGGSLIASNISAEQFIGMSGSGYAVGFAIAAYELMAAITLLLVAKFFLPVFINKGIYTIPQFLEERFDSRVRTGLAIFWVSLFIFVNISSVLYLGSLAINTMTGLSMTTGVLLLTLYSASFSITGGLKAVVWTDVIQVIMLILGGLLASYMVLDAVGGGFWTGLTTLYEKAPEKFDMILDKSNVEYKNLPGISVLIGGMWVANLYYWGTNQYIIQRALAAESLAEAQKGTAFAALMKVILPLIVVIPGIAAYVLNAQLDKPDEAYPWVLNNYVGTGFRGLALAALIAAIGSSISSMVNSASTIFTLDIYKVFFLKSDQNTSTANDIGISGDDKILVKVGKRTAMIALIIGAIIAPNLDGLDQAFQYIQEYTGFISPGVLAIFIMGIFWKKTTSDAALIAVLLAIPLSVFFKFVTPDMPFMDRMGLCFIILVVQMILVSHFVPTKSPIKSISISPSLFKTNRFFNTMSAIVIILVALIYTLFW